LADAPFPALERLFGLLVAREVGVGVLERLRLEHILERSGAPREPMHAPEVSPEALAFTAFIDDQHEVLRRRVRALLAKSPEQGRVVEEALATWLTTLPRLARKGGRPSDAPWRPKGAPTRIPRRRWVMWVVFGSAVIAIAIVVVVVWWPSAIETSLDDVPTDADGPVVEDPVEVVVTPQPPPPPEPEPLPYPLWLFGLGIVGFAVVVGLVAAALARPRFPPPLPAPRSGGDARAGVQVRPRGLLLLDRGAQDALVWGIGQVQSDMQTERLDAARTVAATAEHGGILALRFEHARAYRGVWLWIDRRGRATRDALRLADEVERTLIGAGLPVHRAMFSGIPEWLELEDGARRTPAQLASLHRGARVVVLTDGAVFVAQGGDATRRPRVSACLADLGDWEALAVADLGRDDRFALLLHRGGVPRIESRDVVAHLAGLRAARRAGRGDLLAWEVACAVVLRPVSEDEALELRATLRLDVMPWDLPALRERAPGPNNTLQWTDQARAAVFERLDRGERYTEGVAAGSVLARALKWWLERCAAVEAASLRGDPRWRETLPGLRLACERATLELWTRPDDAVRALFAMLEHDAQHIRARVGGYVDADTRPGPGQVRLPWRLRERPRGVRVMLKALGFVPAVNRPEGVVRPAMVGPLAGFAVAGVGVLAWPEASVAAARQLAVAVVVATLVMGAAWWVLRASRGRSWRLGHLVSNAALAAVLWRYEPGFAELPVVELDPPVVVDGTTSESPPPESTGDPETAGPAPETTGPPAAQPPLPQPVLTCPDGQVLVKGKCKQKRTRPPAVVRDGLMEVWPVVEVAEPAPRPVVDVSAGAPAVEGQCPGGMAYIEGTGPDGFVDGETSRNHVVKSVCVDLTEVTVAAYKRCVDKGNCTTPDSSEYCNWGVAGRESHPVNCVDLEQAKAHCKAAGKRLLTEWEWEWAARGRDEARVYPWGSEAPSCVRAVMSAGVDGCGKNRTWPVDSMPSGDSRDGLKDMAGNVWEWTSSAYNDKNTGVRGFSWNDDDPDWFRAAYRYAYAPADRSNDLGFRCARTAPT